MKRVLFLFALASVLLTSCNSNRDAMSVARDFLQAYYIDYDFDRARARSTVATHEHMQEWILIFELTPRSLTHLNFSSFEIEGVDVLTNRATVNYRVDNTQRQLLLRKINGRWLVDMPIDVATNRLFSLSHNRPDTGGFASAQSQPTRLGGPTEE